MKGNKLKITGLLLTIAILAAVIFAFSITVSAVESDENHVHDMADATCTEPATCKNGCGHTEGYALTHSWVDSEIQGKKECTRCGELLLPDFDFVTRPYATLAETGFDAEQMLSIFPDVIETKYENGKYMVKDIGAFGAEYFNTFDYSRAPMTLEDGYWTIEISQEEYDAVIAAGENFAVDFYSEDRFWQIVYRNGRISDVLQIATPGNIYIASMQTGWDVVDFAYPIFDRHYRDSYEAGVLWQQQVSFWGDDYLITAYYFPDGILDYVSLYIYSEGNFYYYVQGFGWANNPSGDPEYACDAPAGYEDKDADYFTALVPTNINCTHEEYSAADCFNPEICLVCGIVKEGSGALGHDWIDATCFDPKTCLVCGETEGDALGHDWEDATYDAPKTCKECGETEGEPLVDPDPEAPTQMIIMEVTDTTITISWTASPSEDVVKYVIFDWNTREDLGETTGTEFTLTGLTPSTDYAIAVCAVDAAGNRSLSQVNPQVTTLATPDTDTETTEPIGEETTEPTGEETTEPVGEESTESTEEETTESKIEVTESETEKKGAEATENGTKPENGGSDGGCGSSIGFGAVAIVAILGAAVLLKKKEN